MDDRHAGNAYRQFLPHLLTEPMTVCELAEWFGVHRNTMRKHLASIDGVERFGRLYRLPVRAMPVGYYVAKGLPGRAA